MIEDATINFIKGDTCSRDFTISDYDMDINKVLFSIKNNENDKRSILQKSLEMNLNNLFDKNNYNELNAYIHSSSNIIKSSDIIKTIYIECKPNTTYTIKMDNTDGNMRVATTLDTPTAEMPVLQNVGAQYSRPNTSITITTLTNVKFLLLQYYSNGSSISKQEIIDSIEIKQDTISNGITLVSDEDGVKTYNLLINANDTDNLKTDYEYFFAIKIFTYESEEDIELTPIKGTLTLSVRGD